MIILILWILLLAYLWGKTTKKEKLNYLWKRWLKITFHCTCSTFVSKDAYVDQEFLQMLSEAFRQWSCKGTKNRSISYFSLRPTLRKDLALWGSHHEDTVKQSFTVLERKLCILRAISWILASPPYPK
jgi:hypothetical protein